MKKISEKWLGVALVLGAVACGAPKGPHIHVATATRQDLLAAEGSDTIWYEFRPGDRVPLQFLFIGVGIAASDKIEFVAKEHFYIVMRENAPMQFSFDGKTFAGPNTTELLVAVVPGDDERAKVLWLNHVGNGGTAAEALKQLQEEARSTPPAPSNASAPSAEPAGN